MPGEPQEPLAIVLTNIRGALDEGRRLVVSQDHEAHEDPPAGDASARIAALNALVRKLHNLLGLLMQEYGDARAEHRALEPFLKRLSPIPETSQFRDAEYRESMRAAMEELSREIGRLEEDAGRDHAYQQIHRLARDLGLDLASVQLLGAQRDGRHTFYSFVISTKDRPYLYYNLFFSDDFSTVKLGDIIETQVAIYKERQQESAAKRKITRRRVLKGISLFVGAGGMYIVHEKWVAGFFRFLGKSIDEFYFMSQRLKDIVASIGEFDTLNEQYQEKHDAIVSALGDDAQKIDDLITHDRSFKNVLTSLQINYDEFTKNSNDVARKSILGKIEHTPVHETRGKIYDWMQEKVFGRDMHQTVEVSEEGKVMLVTYDQRFEDIRAMENGLYQTTRHIKEKMSDLLRKADKGSLTPEEKAELLALAAAWQGTVKSLAEVKEMDRHNVNTWGRHHPDLKELAQRINAKERDLKADPLYAEALQRYEGRGMVVQEWTVWGSRLAFVAGGAYIAHKLTPFLSTKKLTRREFLKGKFFSNP